VANYMLVYRRPMARGLTVLVLEDTETDAADRFGVIRLYSGRIVINIVQLTREDAFSLAYTLELIPGPEGDSGWLSVLDRLMDRAPEVVDWRDTPAEFATRFYAVGTWNWFATMADTRRQQLRSEDAQ
jgi:hypothetical protein